MNRTHPSRTRGWPGFFRAKVRLECYCKPELGNDADMVYDRQTGLDSGFSKEVFNKGKSYPDSLQHTIRILVEGTNDRPISIDSELTKLRKTKTSSVR